MYLNFKVLLYLLLALCIWIVFFLLRAAVISGTGEDALCCEKTKKQNKGTTWVQDAIAENDYENYTFYLFNLVWRQDE